MKRRHKLREGRQEHVYENGICFCGQKSFVQKMIEIEEKE